MRTKARFGHWGPTLIDTVILSLGKAFVGSSILLRPLGRSLV